MNSIYMLIYIVRSVHFHLQPRRFYTKSEIEELKKECWKLGKIFPRVFHASITPKLDTLIFIIPMFAEKWGTVGGLREEALEKLHNQVNQMLRILACVRKREDRLLMALQRNEMREPDLVKPVPRSSRE